MSTRKDFIIRVRLTKEEFEALKKIAEANKTSVSELVRRALKTLQPATEEESSVDPEQQVHDDGHNGSVSIIDKDDLFTLAIADRLLTMLALHGKEVIRFDEIRAYLKTIKPAIFPHQEQNIVYMLQGLGILKPIGNVPLVTDGKRRTGLFKICLPEDALLNGLASIILKQYQHNNGHELRNNNVYILPTHSYMWHDSGAKT
jgi:hypothetical protein